MPKIINFKTYYKIMLYLILNCFLNKHIHLKGKIQIIEVVKLTVYGMFTKLQIAHFLIKDGNGCYEMFP